MRGLTSLLIDRNAAAETEVTDFYLTPIEANEDVGRFQVSVDHVAGVHSHEAK